MCISLQSELESRTFVISLSLLHIFAPTLTQNKPSSRHTMSCAINESFQIFFQWVFQFLCNVIRQQDNAWSNVLDLSNLFFCDIFPNVLTATEQLRSMSIQFYDVSWKILCLGWSHSDDAITFLNLADLGLVNSLDEQLFEKSHLQHLKFQKRKQVWSETGVSKHSSLAFLEL